MNAAIEVRREAASNEDTSPKILAELAFDEDSDVRCDVASNPSTSPRILEQLSRDKEAYIRGSVAGNPSTSSKTLIYLIFDDDVNVRRDAASNPSATLEILTIAMDDEDMYVIEEAIENLSTPGLKRVRRHRKVIKINEPDPVYKNGKKFCFDMERMVKLLKDVMEQRFPYAYWTVVTDGEAPGSRSLTVVGNKYEMPTSEEQEYASDIGEDGLADPDFWFEVTND